MEDVTHCVILILAADDLHTQAHPYMRPDGGWAPSLFLRADADFLVLDFGKSSRSLFKVATGNDIGTRKQ